ncbi:MAG: trehalose-phosphatase [Burkholderiaceae bacterium]|nr:trehalose-phosphatase [Burkholderiaceae bacterium]
MPTLPPIHAATALFLDFDGTLAEIAPRPDAVRTAPELATILGALNTRLGGALAIVSGRPVVDLDHFLAPLRPALAAEHGAVLRFADGSMQRCEPPDLREAVLAARTLAARHEGLVLEEKSAAVALHYRGAPRLAGLCHDTFAAVVARHSGLDLLHGKCLVEIKPAGVNKGGAIAALMAREPFAERQPIFAGDDVTDEAGFARVQAMGGYGIKVGDGATLAMHTCESPEALRRWLDAGAETP